MAGERQKARDNQVHGLDLRGGKNQGPQATVCVGP